MFFIASSFAWLLINDSPITWSFSELYIFGTPVLFALAGVFAIVSFRIQSNKLLILLSIVSIIALIVSLLIIGYVYALGSAWQN